MGITQVKMEVLHHVVRLNHSHDHNENQINHPAPRHLPKFENVFVEKVVPRGPDLCMAEAAAITSTVAVAEHQCVEVQALDEQAEAKNYANYA